MPITITNAFVSQYNANLELLMQQKGSKLRGTVMSERVRGKDAYFDQIGAVEAVKKTTRHSDTPVIDTPFSRRKVILDTFQFSDLVDNDDKVRMLIDPTSDMARNVAYAMGRSIDKVVLEALVGTAHAGESGATDIALPNSAIIDNSATAVFNVDALIDAKTLMDQNDVPEEERYFAVQAADLKNLLKDTKVTSADYASVKALVNGQIDSFMGFKFVRVGDSVWTSAGIAANSAIAFHKTGLKLAIGQDIISHIDPRPDKNYATQVYSEMTIGAGRMDEKRVVLVKSKAS